MGISQFLRQKRKSIGFIISAVCLIALLAPMSFGAVTQEEQVFFRDATFLFPSGSSVGVHWVLPPRSTTPRNAGFSIDNTGAPLIGYGNTMLMNPYEEFVTSVEGGFSAFTHLENGVLLLAKANDIGSLAKLKKAAKKTEVEKGIPAMRFQPITSVPVKRCELFGSFKNTAYCAGPNEMSGEYELYLLQSDNEVGLKELAKAFASREPIAAVAGDDDILFVAIGQRVFKIESKKKSTSVSLHYQHPSAEVRGLAYHAGSGLFVSTGSELLLSGTKGAVEIMTAPEHRIAMQQGRLYVFFPKTLGLLVIGPLEDLKRFNLSVDSIAPAPGKKSALRISDIRFFESGTDYPYAVKTYAQSFDCTSIRSLVSEFTYQRTDSSQGKKQHTILVSWFEPKGDLLTSQTYTITLPPNVAAGTAYARIGGESKGGYEKTIRGTKRILGQDALGLRYPGNYRMTVHVDGVLAEEALFTIRGNPSSADVLAYDDTEEMQRLLNNGLDPNEKDQKGTPLLIRAIEYGNPRMVALLLEKKANPNAWYAGKRPLAVSIMQNTPECLEQLLNKGALSSEVLEEQGVKQSALFVSFRHYVQDEKKNDDSARMKRVRIIRMLLEKGAELGPKEGSIIFEGSVATLVGNDVCFKMIRANDATLESAAKGNHEMRQLAMRRYVEKTKEATVSATEKNDLQKALRFCNTVRNLYDTMDTRVRGEIMPEIPLYCGLLEHQIGGMQEQAQTDLNQYLTLAPEAENAAKIRTLLEEMKK